MQHDGVTDTCTVTAGGMTLDIGPDARSLVGDPSGSDSLLIYGTEDGSPWFVSVGPDRNRHNYVFIAGNARRAVTA